MQHLARDDAAHRQPHEYIRALQNFRERARLRVDRESLLELVEIVAAGVDDAFVVAHHDVVALDTEAHVMLRGRDSGRAGAGEHDLDLVEAFLDQLQRVEERRARNDRRAVLVVVENGDAQRLAELLLDVETVW